MFSFLRLSFSQSRIFSRCSSRRFCYEFPIRHPAETEAVGTTWCWYLHWLCRYRLSYLEFTWQLQRMTNGTNNSHGSSLAAILDVHNVGISCQQIGSWLMSRWLKRWSWCTPRVSPRPPSLSSYPLFLSPFHVPCLIRAVWTTEIHKLGCWKNPAVWSIRLTWCWSRTPASHWCQKKRASPLTPLEFHVLNWKMFWDSRPFPFLQQPIRLCSQKFIKAPLKKKTRKRARNDDFSYM